MDLKSLARSKRAHTQHHQPRKPRNSKPRTTPDAPASSSSPSNDPDIAKKEAKERKRESGGSSLPSNWDRYVDPDAEDEYGGGELWGSNLETVADRTATAMTDVVKPKSKGADFGFLISQAKSQPAACSSVSLDDVLPDYCRGLGSMLSVRGENLVSWTGGDCFLAEDESISSAEAPFLSLNLQTLAEELSNVDLAKRLFIDPCLLPPELRGNTKTYESNSSMSHGTLIQQKDEAAHISTLSSQTSSDKERPPNVDDKIPASKGLQNTHQALSNTLQEVKSGYHAGGPKSNLSGISDSKLPFAAKHATDISNRVPTFKATAAEAELDSLLNSLSETKLVDNDSSSTVNINIQGNSDESGNTSTVPFCTEKSTNSGSHKPALNLAGSSQKCSNLDDELDSLLSETSSVGNTNLSLNYAPVSSSSSSHPSASKSKVMEDFDSWLDTI